MRLFNKLNYLFIITILILFFFSFACRQNDTKTEPVEKPANDQTVIASSTDAIVKTESGKVRGYIHSGTFTFKGIPYAKAERFMPPEKPDVWKDLKSTLTYGPWSPQTISGSLTRDEELFTMDPPYMVQGEDCQEINIWTQGINDDAKRPVMVWLHGGGFSGGSASEQRSYDGENLSKKGNVVVVSLNHRLNVLGFLDLSDFGEKYKHSGNVGMMDIVAALEWVKTNITNFGGDPGNVTIFGQSGGGGKVSTLLATPAAKGLFHKAIIQSGSTLKVSESAVSKKAGRAILEELGLKPSQVDELQKLPYDVLSAAGEKAWARVRREISGPPGGFMRLSWSPVVDGDYLPVQPFDPVAPEISKDIPLMVGTTINEIFPSLLNPALRNLTSDQVLEQIKNRYKDKADAFIEEFGRVFPGYTHGDLLDTDFRMRKNAIRQAQLKAAQQGAPVYMYLFSWQNPLFDGVYKSIHCMEIPFVFNNVGYSAKFTGGEPEAISLGEKVSQAWINFAKTGNPNHAGLPEWPVFTDKNRSTMVFNNECIVKDSHDRKLLEIISGN